MFILAIHTENKWIKVFATKKLDVLEWSKYLFMSSILLQVDTSLDKENENVTSSVRYFYLSKNEIQK